MSLPTHMQCASNWGAGINIDTQTVTFGTPMSYIGAVNLFIRSTVCEQLRTQADEGHVIINGNHVSLDTLTPQETLRAVADMLAKAYQNPFTGSTSKMGE